MKRNLTEVAKHDIKIKVLTSYLRHMLPTKQVSRYFNLSLWIMSYKIDINIGIANT